MSTTKGPLGFSFDIGHSSIGWAVIESKATDAHPNILGCGSVIFPAEDCLASVRRDFRRTRRNIRATRLRIARIKLLLSHLGVLTEEQLDTKGDAAPWKLAAQALVSDDPLTWEEIWHVLRWYAHNRGYDGNRRWSKIAEENEEDTEKVLNAIALMAEHNKSSMAETVCSALNVDPLGKKRSSHLPYKTLNVAFPREIVAGEGKALLAIANSNGTFARYNI